MDTIDYVALFEQSQGLVLVIDTNFTIVAASDDFIKKTKTTRENITGRDIFVVFPLNPEDRTSDGESKMRASFNWVIKNKTADTLPIVRYDIPKRTSESGGFESKYWKVINSPILDANNNVKYIIQRSEDVTENETLLALLDLQKKALKQLEDSEKRYNMMLMRSPFGFAIFKGKNMVISLANDSIKEMWGKGNDVEGKPLFDVIAELKDSAFPELLDKVYTTGIPFYGDELLAPILRNGKLEDAYFNFVYQPYLEADETISGVTIIAIEVTNEVNAKQKIKDSQQQLQNIFMQAPFALNIYEGKELVISLANKLFCEIIGKSESEILGKKLFDAFPETATQGLDKILSDIFSTGIPFKGNEFPVRFLKDGNEFKGYFDFIYHPIFDYNKNVSGVINVAIDVTDKVLARKKIEESDKRYNLMLKHSSFTFAVLKGKDLIIDLANDRIKEVWGIGNDIEGKSLLDLMPDLKNTSFPALLDEVRATGIPFHGNEVQSPKSLHGDLREEYFFNFVFQPYLEADETISGITIIGNDVTEQVYAKRKIEESEQRLRLMADLMPAKINNASVDGSVTYFNKHWLDFSGYTFEELRDFGYHQIMHPDEVEEFQERFQKAAETGTDLVMEMRFKNKQGDYVWHLNIASPIKDKNGIHEMWIGVTTEIHEQKTVAEKIKASEERFRLLVMLAPVAICVLRGEDFIFETLNQEMANLLDIKIEDSLGKPLFDVITEVKDQVYKQLLDDVYRTGNRFVSPELSLTIHRKSMMEDVFVKFVYEPLREADGTISGVMVLSDEITDQVNARKAIEVSEKMFRVLTNNMPQKITNADAEGNIKFFNQQWLEDTGLTFDELVAGGWVKTIHPDDLEPMVNSWKHSVATGDVFDVECRIKNKEGAYRWHLSRSVSVKDETGKIIMWVGSKTDIHELKEAKSKAEAATHLAEEAMQGKQQFLSNMSHEIRTPMNAIIGFTNVLLKSKLDKTQEEYLTAIKVSGDALLVLINDILDLAKVDAGRMTFEKIPFNLATSLSAMLLLFDIKIKEKNLELVEQLDTAIPEIILGDPTRLRQIILNLVSNAVKFTEVGKITMGVALLKQDSEEVTLEFKVTDTGIGIHKNKLEHIFDDFGQATYENSRLYGGTGLGLSIVRKLTEQQGGTIHVESELGKGSVFSFELSFAKTNQKIKHQTERVYNKQAEIINLKVLVAEDMPLNQLLIKIILADFGFEVEIAENGKIAIEKLQQKKYDLVLMDLQMPEMNGFEATTYVRNTMNSNIPIIALTADVTTIDADKARAVGMNDYISKPIDEQLLYSKIIDVLQKTE
ncbi:PAS domain S-box protein [Flavobacterium sp. XS1P32]|uniref:PAS domain S-box protein n=1 Tax=Flavobacterium sp. XS1P32 TaxID=3401726 RepID=UPI003AAEB3F7